MGRAYNCWILNCWWITWPVGFKRLRQNVIRWKVSALIAFLSRTHSAAHLHLDWRLCSNFVSDRIRKRLKQTTTTAHSILVYAASYYKTTKVKFGGLCCQHIGPGHKLFWCLLTVRRGVLDGHRAHTSSADKFWVERCPATVTKVLAGVVHQYTRIQSAVQIVREVQRDVFINSKILMLSLDGFLLGSFGLNLVICRH